MCSYLLFSPLVFVLVIILSHLTCQDDILNVVDIRLLVECACSAKDGVTRNHVFSLLSGIAKVVPDKLSDHISDILAVVGGSTVSQVS